MRIERAIQKGLFCLAALAFILGATPSRCVAAVDGDRQPVFLLCPHKEHYSSWSLFLVVDRKDKSKVLALGLEKLKKQNALDSSYDAVLAAQFEPTTPREDLGMLDAKDFGSGALEVKENDALRVTLTPVDPGTLRLGLSMRINVDERFEVGGAQQSRRDIVFQYDKVTRRWGAVALKLENAEGAAAVTSAKSISGLAFPVNQAISRIVAVVDGNPVILLDK